MLSSCSSRSSSEESDGSAFFEELSGPSCPMNLGGLPRRAQEDKIHLPRAPGSHQSSAQATFVCGELSSPEGFVDLWPLSGYSLTLCTSSHGPGPQSAHFSSKSTPAGT